MCINGLVESDTPDTKQPSEVVLQVRDSQISKIMAKDIKPESESSLINDIKLRYLCCNKLPRIIFVLMHGDDYVINTLLLIRLGVWR